MIQINVGKNTYGLAYGTYTIGGVRYLVDHKGIVAQNNFTTRNIYTHNAVDGRDEGEKILHQIEVEGLARSYGVI